MIKVNEYFGGNVKSLVTDNTDGNATVGVIAAGEYEFGTSSIEIMTIVWGTIEALLPGEKNWKSYSLGQCFKVDKGQKFKVRTKAPVAYLCQYI